MVVRKDCKIPQPLKVTDYAEPECEPKTSVFIRLPYSPSRFMRQAWKRIGRPGERLDIFANVGTRLCDLASLTKRNPYMKRMDIARGFLLQNGRDVAPRDQIRAS